MAISFPASPSTNDVYQYNDIKYVYDGVKWIASGKSFFDLNTGLLSDGTITPNAATITNDLTVDTDTLYVDSTNDRVGVGTNTPQDDVEVVSATPSVKCRATADSAPQFILDNARADDVVGGRISARWNGNTVSRIDFRNGADAVNQDDGSIAFSTSESGSSPVERMRVTSGGITFNGDTAAANALDDYEEGTWTPTFYGGTTAGSYTFTLTSAQYVKIGRMVTATADLDNITTVSAGTGPVRVGGLPFTSISEKACGSVFMTQFDVGDSVVNLACRTEGFDWMIIPETRDSSTGASVQVTDKTGDGADIELSITYFTDA